MQKPAASSPLNVLVSSSPSLVRALVCLSAAEAVAIDAGDVVVALAAAAGSAASPAPAWIKIAPRGTITTRNGKSYSFNPEALAARFSADGTAIPVDFEHSTVHLAAKGEKADAVGWIEKMEARQDGLYANVEWLDAGKAALSARTHRFVSPSFPQDADGNAVWLHSVALVTAPALSNMPALAHSGAADRTSTEITPMSKTLALALGLSETASEAAMLSAIGDLKKKDDSKDTVPKELHDQTLATLSAATARIETIETGIRAEKVKALLDGALMQKRIVPAQRADLEALCVTDAGLEQVTKLIAASPVNLAASSLDGRTPETGLVGGIDPVTLAASARAYETAQKAAGVDISYLDALAHVEAEQKKGAK